jgi:hypothetical protein
VININELRQKITARGLDVVADTDVLELLDRLEAAERERDELRAKIEAMEQQEPVGTLYDDGCFVWRDSKPHEYNYAAWKMKHYALPGAQSQPAPSVPVLTPAARDILGERRRQIEVECWTPLHDDAHDPGDLSSAAMGYAQSAACKLSHEGLALEGLPLFWPWEASWFKPSTARQDLVKAGALILAEIERLDRAVDPGTASRPIVPSVPDESVRKAWGRFCNELHRSPDAPYPGMSEAFEAHFSQSFTDRDWRMESGVWAAAWKASKNHDAQPAQSVSDAVIEQAVNRFLSWKLPKDFRPDGGVVFIPTKGRGYDSPYWPSGTNLLNAQQAREMLRHVLSAAPEAKAAPSVPSTALKPVINWLRNGCDPLKAAIELELLAAAPEAKP